MALGHLHSKREWRRGPKTVTIPIMLDSATDRDLRIPITATADSGEGTAADDYKLSANEVVIPAGQSRKTITVKHNDDDDLTADSVALGFGTAAVWRLETDSRGPGNRRGDPDG